MPRVCFIAPELMAGIRRQEARVIWIHPRIFSTLLARGFIRPLTS